MHVKRRLSTAFHPQTDGQTERQNQTLEHYLRTYCSDKQNDWAMLLPIAEFAYRQSHHSTIGCSPFKAMYGYNPVLELRLGDETAQGEVPAAKERIKEIDLVRQELTKRWQGVLDSQAKSYNKKHQKQEFQQGDLVLLSAKYLKQKRPNKKLSDKAIGPFRIRRRIGTQAYHLWLPPTYQIHPVFHVSLLEPYQRRPGDAAIPEYPIPDLIDDDEIGDVEAILGKRKSKGVTEYLIRWVGYPEDYDQWIAEEDVHAEDLVNAFNKQPSRRRKARKAHG